MSNEMGDSARLKTKPGARVPAASASTQSGAARRIAVILREFSSGGSERVAIRLANQWSRSGRQVTLIVGSDTGPVRDLVGPEVAIHALGNDAKSASDVGSFATGIADAARAIRPDVIVGPGNSYVTALHRVRSRMRGGRTAIVCKISNPLRREDRSRVGQWLFERRFRYLTRGFDGLSAMSPALRTEAQHLLGRRDIAALAEPNLDTRAPPSRTDVQPNHILCVGRLSAQKNFALALETLALLGDAYRMTILGEGEEMDALIARAARLNVTDRVRFAGFVGDVSPHLAKASVLLSTSRFEGFPAALVEAVAAGLPIVSTPCSMALPDIVLDPSFGLVVPADRVLLARAVHLVCTRKGAPDAALLATFVDQHQVSRSAELWLDWLDGVVVSSRPATSGRAGPSGRRARAVRSAFVG